MIEMDAAMKSLLLEIAGFLRLVQDGFPVSKQEASHLISKIGQALEPAQQEGEK